MKIQAVYNNKFVKKGLEFAADNSALFYATTSLALASTIRPIAIALCPKAKKEDKKYAISKSFSSGITGFIATALISVPIAQAIKKIDENPKQYLKEETIKKLCKNGNNVLASSKYKFATQLFKTGICFLIAAPKTLFTTALIPNVKEKLNKKKTNSNINFKGSYDKHIEKLANKIGKVIDSDIIQKISDKFHTKNYKQHMVAMSDAFTTGILALCISQNNKIEKERKKPLIDNSIISTSICIASAYALDSVTNKTTNNFVDRFIKANGNSIKNNKYLEGMQVGKIALIFGSIYYIVAPFISTHLSAKINNKSE